MTDEEKKEVFEHGFRVCLMSVETMFVMAEKVTGVPMTEVYAETLKEAEIAVKELSQEYVNEGFDVMRLRCATAKKVMSK